MAYSILQISQGTRLCDNFVTCVIILFDVKLMAKTLFQSAFVMKEYI